jgi:hypothetical protein
MFVSFKLREEEWEQEGRFFSGYSEKSFRGLIEGQAALLPESICVSDDARPGRRDETWLNAFSYDVRRTDKCENPDCHRS